VDEFALYLYANKVELPRATEQDRARTGMLCEGVPASFSSEEDEATQQAFLRQVTLKSQIHKSTLFKDTSC
jgi:hypothetical protein